MDLGPNSTLKPAAPGSVCITPEEESALLAEFGVHGPNDAFLEVPAVSRFRSDYGEPNVFLTGAGESSKNVCDMALGHTAADQVSDTAFLRFPLDLFAYHVTSALNSEAPWPLRQRLFDTLQHLGDAKSSPSDLNPFTVSPNAKGTEEGATKEVLRTARTELIHATHLLNPRLLPVAEADPAPSFDNPTVLFPVSSDAVEEWGSSGLPDDVLLAESDALIAQADACLQKPTELNRYTDPYVLEVQRRLEKEEQLLQDDELNFSLVEYDTTRLSQAGGDEDNLSHTPIAGQQTKEEAQLRSTLEPREGTEWLPESKMVGLCGLTDNTPALDQVLCLPLSPLPRLFAFEYGPTVEQANELQQWDVLLQQAQARLFEVEGLAARPAVTSPVKDEMGGHLATHSHSVEILVDGAVLAARTDLATEGGSVVPSLNNEPVVMHSTEPIQERSAGLEEQTEWRLEPIENSRQRGISADERYVREKQRRDQRGLIMLDPFLKRLDALVPPTPQELALRVATESPANEPLLFSDAAPSPRGARHVDSAHCPTALAPHATSSEAPSILKRIQLQSGREEMLIQNEGAEYRCMLAEDARMERIMLAQELEREACIQRFLQDWEMARDKLISDELACFQELCCNKRDHAVLAQEIFFKRRAREMFRAVDALLEACQAARQDVQQSSEAAWTHLIQQEAGERAVLRAQIEARRYEEDAGRRSGPDERAALGDQPPAGLVKAPAPLPSRAAEELHGGDGASYLHTGLASGDIFTIEEVVAKARSSHVAVLAREYQARCDWLRSRGKELQHLMKLIQTEIEFRRQHRSKGYTAMKASAGDTSEHCQVSFIEKTGAVAERVAAEGLTTSLGPHVCLDGALLQKIQTPLFLAAREGSVCAPACFYAVSFALENIRTVNWQSLRCVTLHAADVQEDAPHCAAASGCVCDWVCELDLSSNLLDALSFSELLGTFPALRKLSLSDNHLVHLEDANHGGRGRFASSASASLRSVAAAQQNAMAERTRLSELSLSSNQLKDLESVGQCLSCSLTRLSAYANQLVSLEPLRSCLRLTHLELNRNGIADVAPLESLHLLQELNLCDNAITQLNPLAMGCWPLLEKLFVSNNKLTSLLPYSTLTVDASQVPHYMFLTQLFVNYNRIETLADDMLPWMPMLSVLQAGNNQLREISGLSRCPRLTTVKFPFNRLQRVEDLVPLFSCQLLCAIDVRGNPLMAGEAQERGKIPPPAIVVRELASPGRLLGTLLERNLPRLTEFNSEPFRAFASSPSLEAEASGSRPPAPLDSSPVLDASAADCAMLSLRADREDLFLLYRRRFHSAVVSEKQLREKMMQTHRVIVPAADQLSSEIQEEEQLVTLEFFCRALTTLVQDAGGSMGGISHASDQDASSALRQAAGDRIAAWLHGFLLVRRARRELREKRLAWAQRSEKAARRIQSVWRGAALRTRLRRILHSSSVDLDVDGGLFQKVQLTLPDILADDPSKGLAQIMRQAIIEEENLSLPGFKVDSFGPKKPAKANYSLPGDMGRPSTGPGVQQRTKPSAASTLPNFHDTAPASSPLTDARLDSQKIETSPWGAAVASQLKKKRQKMQREHQRQLCEEFMRNPLKIKHKMSLQKTVKKKE